MVSYLRTQDMMLSVCILMVQSAFVISQTFGPRDVQIQLPTGNSSSAAIVNGSRLRPDAILAHTNMSPYAKYLGNQLMAQLRRSRNRQNQNTLTDQPAPTLTGPAQITSAAQPVPKSVLIDPSLRPASLRNVLIKPDGRTHRNLNAAGMAPADRPADGQWTDGSDQQIQDRSDHDRTFSDRIAALLATPQIQRRGHTAFSRQPITGSHHIPTVQWNQFNGYFGRPRQRGISVTDWI